MSYFAPTGLRFNRLEWAGAFGDLGTLIPFVIAYIALGNVDPVGIFLSFGLALSTGYESLGEVVLRGNNVMLGYYKDERATAEAFRGGWYHTGDAGHIDDEGFVSFDTIGGWDPQVFVGQRVRLLGRAGPVAGVVGTLMTNMAVELALRAQDVEFVRAKSDRFVLGLSTSQIMSIILLIVAAFLWYRQSKAKPAPLTARAAAKPVTAG